MALVVGSLCAMLPATAGTFTVSPLQTEADDFKAAPSATGRWWVVLEGAPTLEFEGGHLRPLQTARREGQLGLTQRYQATSPRVTGRRFDPQSAEVRSYAKALDQHREQVLSHAQRILGRAIQPHVVLHHTGNAFSAAMTVQEARKLAMLDGVVSVTPVEVHTPQMDRSPQLIGATSMWNGSWNPWAPVSNLPRVRGEGMVIGVIDSGINVDHRVFSDNPDQGATHNYSNPYGRFLGECTKTGITCNNKLVGVYDFTTEGTLGRDPDGDGHGTHVASIAAGNPWAGITLSNISGSFSMTGVAPHAHIISYKVCYDKHPTDSDLDGRCVGDAIRRAFEQAILDDVDVVNYSIGGDPIDPWRSSSVPRLVLNFWSANIPFVTSAGNSGPEAGSVGQPANAPWAIAVGNSTHDRRITNSIDVGTRTRIAAQPGTGPSLSADINASARRVDAVSAGNLLACDPLPSDSLQGQIAVIERGDCFFIDKVRHATDAGAVAVIMVNQQPGEAITMGGLEDSTIPAVMIARDIGQVVLGDLQSGALSATLRADTEVIISADLQDTLASSSSRGPTTTPRDIIKPDLVAPGSAIFAAYVPNNNSLSFLSGTSMSSPQVAGALALLRQIHPSWGVDALMSAVVTTADHDRILVEGRSATPDEQGGGRLRVDRAARAGLYLPVTVAEFEAADPARGGVPRTLNLPGMSHSGCGERCEFTRRVRAHRAGSWTVTVEGDLPVTVFPSQFSLQAGEEQTLRVQATPSANLAAAVQTAQVVLTPQVSSTPIFNQIPMITQRLSVSVLSGVTELPGGLRLTSSSNRGSGRISIGSLEPVTELQFVSSSLVLPEQEVFDLPQHGNTSDPFDGRSGTTTRFLDVAPGTLALYAATLASTASDIDLFVGRSPSGADVVDSTQTVCASISPDEIERCVIKQPQPGRWWIVVQNWEASTPDAKDEVVLAYATVSAGDDTTLTASGPGRHAGGEIAIEVSFDQPLMAPDQTWFGAFEVKAFGGESLGVVPVVFERTQWTLPVTTVLFPGEPYKLLMEAGRSHDRLFIDVPASATELRVRVQGDAGVSASLRRIDFDDVLATQPATPSAPGPDLVSGEGSSAGFDLVRTAPAPGRYYVVLNNQPVIDRTVTVTATLSESGGALPRMALWQPEVPGINQGIDFQRFGTPFILWYSYDRDGYPVFYLGGAPERSGSSVWVTPVDGFSSGGQNNVNALVGRASITALGAERFMFSWRLNGAHGSWIMEPSAPQACVEVDGAELSYSGAWHSPNSAGTGSKPQGGSSVLMLPWVQFHVRYFYDEAGVGRWVVLADDSVGPLARELDVLEFRGFCPNCTPVTPNSQVIGAYFREFTTERTGFEMLSFKMREPFGTEIELEVDIERLSDRLPCP
jgi:subtilisin family serine protease